MPLGRDIQIVADVARFAVDPEKDSIQANSSFEKMLPEKLEKNLMFPRFAPSYWV